MVAPLTRRDIHDLFWAQAQLRGELAARATQNMTPGRLRVLETNMERYDQAIASDDSQAIGEIGHQFHREINLAANSHRLALLQSPVVQHVPVAGFVTSAGQTNRAGMEHRVIVEALRKRDPRRARSVMQVHFLDAADRLIETLEDRGLWDLDQGKTAS
jgi:DNA-binding GntR family transcriptional regulator